MQTSLFDDTEPTTPTTHTQPPQLCATCRINPVHWMPRSNRWSHYCGTNTCHSRTRKCTWCGNHYDKTAPGAGTKYCSDQCKNGGYAAGWKGAARVATPCANCGNPFRSEARRKDQICSRCRSAYAGQINRHHMDTTWALRLINATTCDACGDRLNSGGGKHLGVIDHNHSCCPGGRSCGNCIRGIICNRCNTYAGYIESDPQRLQAVTRYLGL